MCKLFDKGWLPGRLILAALLLSPMAAPLASGGTSSVTLAWDPSPDGTVTGYNLYVGGKSRSYTKRISVGNVTEAVIGDLTAGETYYFTATAFNTEGLESDFSNEASYTIPVETDNIPPTLDPIDDVDMYQDTGSRTILLTGITSGSITEDQPLTLRAESNRPDIIPDPVVAFQNPDKFGTITITPKAGASGSVVITVTVDDGQASHNLTQRYFMVRVRRTAAIVALGSGGAMAGKEGSVPLTFESTGQIVELVLVVDVPPGYLNNAKLQGLASEVDPAASILTLTANGSSTLKFVARTGQYLTGKKKLADLVFTAATGRASAFVPLRIREVSALTSTSAAIAGSVAREATLAVINTNALLEARRGSDGSHQLTLFGKPFSSYAIEYTTDLGPSAQWTRLPYRIPLSSVWTEVRGLEPAPERVFYRAVEFTANPPYVEALNRPASERTLLVYGETGSSYTIQMTTNRPSAGANWVSSGTLTLTNSFGYATVPAVAGNSFYRVQRN